MAKDKDANYWKCEYENLRRKKNKEIERMKAQNYHFFCRTWDLIQLLNLPYKFVLDWYRKDK
mgnify:CR=1 FL=1